MLLLLPRMTLVQPRPGVSIIARLRKFNDGEWKALLRAHFDDALAHIVQRPERWQGLAESHEGATTTPAADFKRKARRAIAHCRLGHPGDAVAALIGGDVAPSSLCTLRKTNALQFELHEDCELYM